MFSSGSNSAQLKNAKKKACKQMHVGRNFHSYILCHLLMFNGNVMRACFALCIYSNSYLVALLIFHISLVNRLNMSVMCG